MKCCSFTFVGTIWKEAKRRSTEVQNSSKFLEHITMYIDDHSLFMIDLVMWLNYHKENEDFFF